MGTGLVSSVIPWSAAAASGSYSDTPRPLMASAPSSHEMTFLAHVRRRVQSPPHFFQVFFSARLLRLWGCISTQDHGDKTTRGYAVIAPASRQILPGQTGPTEPVSLDPKVAKAPAECHRFRLCRPDPSWPRPEPSPSAWSGWARTREAPRCCTQS